MQPCGVLCRSAFLMLPFLMVDVSAGGELQGLNWVREQSAETGDQSHLKKQTWLYVGEESDLDKTE